MKLGRRLPTSSDSREEIESLFRFNESEIYSLLTRTRTIQNPAWLRSANSAVGAMERGLIAELFPKFAARRAYKMAASHRQDEQASTSRWHLACLLESLALLRLLALRTRNNTYFLDYVSARDRVLRDFSTPPTSATEGRQMNASAEVPEGAADRLTTTAERTGGQSVGRASSIPLEMELPSESFRAMWVAAGSHIEVLAQGPLSSWLRAHLTPPFLEHLSFRLGNQLFFVRLRDVDGIVAVPGTERGLRAISEGCKGHACEMPMKLRLGEWKAAAAGWGLTDLEGRPIDPVSLISDEPIEMSDWELQDFAVQIVRQDLEASGVRVVSSQSNPSVDPSIWFQDHEGRGWVVVRAVRFPVLAADLPNTWGRIASDCRPISKRGYFASVAVDSDIAESSVSDDRRLLRGHGLQVRYSGVRTPDSEEVDAAEEDFIAAERWRGTFRRPAL